jgi:hypothetical protein
LTLVYAHVLPKIFVTTEILPASFDRTFVRCNRNTKSTSLTSKPKKSEIPTLLVGVDGSYMPLQMFSASKALVAPINGATIHPHVLLHATLHHEYGRRRHPTTTRLLREVRHRHGRSQMSRFRSAYTAIAAHATTLQASPRARHRPSLHKVAIVVAILATRRIGNFALARLAPQIFIRLTSQARWTRRSLKTG